MAARHSNSQFEAISKTSNCHRRRWFDNFQEQKSVVYHLNRSHHFLPDEIQRLSIGPSSKNLILDTLWFHDFSDDVFLIRILKILISFLSASVPQIPTVHTDLEVAKVSKKSQLRQIQIQINRKCLRLIVKYSPSPFLSAFYDLGTFSCIFCPLNGQNQKIKKSSKY